MKTPCLHPTRSHSATAAKALLGVVFAAGLTAITIVPAIADENDSHNSSQHAQRYDAQRGDHQQSHRKQRPTQRYDERYQSRGYANPAYVYAPPPVVYDPRPSPGVSLFFSL